MMMIPQTKPTFSRKVMSIQEFVLDLLPTVDCSPIGQRLPVHSDVQNMKSEAIIISILSNIDIGNITLVDVSGEPTTWIWESLDGGHRKRAIRDFFQGKFTVLGRKYSELSDEEKDAFKRYELAFTMYSPLSNEMKGQIFRSLNETTHVNEIEMLNSYGDTPIANAVRETVRVVTLANGKTSVINELFDVTAGGNFKWIDGNNLRLKQEEFIARVYYTFYKSGKLCNRTTAKVQDMYDNPNLNVNALKKKVDKFLDFLFEMAKVRRQTLGRGLGNSERNALLNLYVYLSDSFGSDLEATDYVEWYKAFSVVYNDLYNDPKDVWNAIPDLEFEGKDSTITQLFKDYTRNHDSAEKQTQMVKWMTDHPEWNKVYEYTLLKDRNRAFPRWMKEVTLQNQGYVCAIDGLPLDWEDAEAGHIEAHALGGQTVLSNCAMIRKSHNSAMGTMDVREYKKIYDEKAVA
jgi:hypothetical protein